MQIEKTREYELEFFKTLYENAFPENERISFEESKKLAAEGKLELLTIKSNDKPFGIAITATHNDVTLLSFFAISEDARNKGIGGEAFEALKGLYKNKNFMVEIEDTECGEEIKVRRKNFYLRHNMKNMPYGIWYNGLKMEIMTNGERVDYDAYLSVYKNTYGKLTPNIQKRL